MIDGLKRTMNNQRKPMNDVIQFNFDNNDMRVIQGKDGEPWFSANDVCQVLELGNPSQALKTHVDSDDLQKMEIIDSLGRAQQANYVNEAGLYALILGSTKPEAKRFKRWVTHEVLPSLRKTGSYATKPAKPITAVDAFKMIPMIVRAAKALGLDKNAAAISANQAVLKITGSNVLSLLGHTHLDNAEQELYFTPTEIGEKMGGHSAQWVNRSLALCGMQVKVGDKWVPDSGYTELFRILDTGKSHGNGTMVQQVKWSAQVIDQLAGCGM